MSCQVLNNLNQTIGSKEPNLKDDTTVNEQNENNLNRSNQLNQQSNFDSLNDKKNDKKNDIKIQNQIKKKVLLNNKHVLITGGAGYLGTSIVPLLLDAGYTVTVYDLFLNGVLPLLSYTSNKNLNLIKGDVLDFDHLKEVMSNVDIIIHLAAVVGYPACDSNPEYAKKLNIEGTRNVTKLFKSNQKLIFSSTGSCYGAVKDICTEETELNPLSLYGQTKVEGEKLALEVNGVVLRFATLFGCSPLIRLDLLINDLTCQALNRSNLDIYEPHFKRTFLHVKDAARSFLFTIENYDKMSGDIFNVGDKKMNYTKEDVVNRIVKYVKNCEFNLCAKGSDKDKRDYYVSYDKINSLGFKSEISLEDGIKELIKVLPAFSKHELNLFRRLSEKIC